MIMTQAELNEILEKHKKWLNNEPGGERANLSGSDLSCSNLSRCNLSRCNLSHCNLSACDLCGSNLRGCDLRGSDLRGCNLRGCNLRGSDLRGCDLSGSDLRGCDLSGSNLSGSDLRGCNLDFSCLPLWCGSLYAYFDDRQIVQFVYHAVRVGLRSPNVSDEVKTELRKMAPLANRFHRAEECGVIEE